MAARTFHPLAWVVGATTLSFILALLARSPLSLAVRLALTAAPFLALVWLGRYQRQPEGWGRSRQSLLIFGVFLASAVLQPAWYLAVLAWGVVFGLIGYWTYTPSGAERSRST